ATSAAFALRASKLSLAHLHELSHNGLPPAGLSAVSLTVPVSFLRITIAGDNSLHKGQREGAQLIKKSTCPH
ncbi:MAG: hypothetical protein J6B18_02410, partial [Bacteroidaceae bacterium]|nr:hypothetical protein [Bacteroidaceae bacterium]